MLHSNHLKFVLINNVHIVCQIKIHYVLNVGQAIPFCIHNAKYVQQALPTTILFLFVIRILLSPIKFNNNKINQLI